MVGIEDDAKELYRFKKPIKSIAIIGAGITATLSQTYNRIMWNSAHEGGIGRRIQFGPHI